MKRLNNYVLLWLSLFAFTWLVYAASSSIMMTDMLSRVRDQWHRPLLNALSLDGKGGDDAWMQVDNGLLKLNKSLVVWSWNLWVPENTTIVIAWWENNQIQSWEFAGIWWWSGNIVNWNYSIIWWWNSNTVNGENSVVVWWINNQWAAWWFVAWWSGNYAWDWGVVLWWENNTTSSWGLVMWSNANAWNGSFSWNAQVGAQWARVNANNGILIWTNKTVSWVNLVVSWFVSVWSEWIVSAQKWDMVYTWWCFYMYDWEYWHAQAWLDSASCKWHPNNLAKTCKFGNTYLQAWDKVKAYKSFLTNWECKKATVECLDWKLITTDTGELWYNSPFCYEYSNVDGDRERIDDGGDGWKGGDCDGDWDCDGDSLIS